MKWIAGAFAAAFALTAVALFTSHGQGQPAEKADAAKPARTLTASGSGTVKVEADVAKVTFKVEASGNDLRSAREALERKAAKIKDSLDATKLGLDVRALPVEIQQQPNFGFGAAPINPIPPMPMAIPGGAAPGALPPAPAPAPALPPALVPENPRGELFVAPVPDKPKKDPAPGEPDLPPVPPMPPAPPMPGGFGGGFALPNMGFNGGAFQVSQSFVVTLKNAEPAKLRDGVNKVLFTSAENGAALANPNNFGQFGGGIGGFGIGGGFIGNPPAAAGPRVTFHRADDKEARRKALELAVADAVANAKVMAKGANVTVIDTLSINDPPATRTGQPISDLGGNFQQENTTGEMEITVRVTVICSY